MSENAQPYVYMDVWSVLCQLSFLTSYLSLILIEEESLQKCTSEASHGLSLFSRDTLLVNMN